MVGQTSDSSDHYVSSGVNWAGFDLAELVAMVADDADPAQLERLAQDWRDTGESVADAAEYLADALNDLMNYWSGESADKARQVVALNAQWVSDLGLTAREMGAPVHEAAGALKAAQEAMPALPAIRPIGFPGAAPHGAAELDALTRSRLGSAVGATAEGSASGFATRAEQEELKRIAVETMQRFEAAALGIDRATPRFLGPDSELRPDPDLDEFGVDPSEAVWVSAVTRTSGVDLRWQVLTGMTDPGGNNGFAGSSATDSSAIKGFTGATSSVGAVSGGPVSFRTDTRAGARADMVLPGRGAPTTPAAAVIGGGNAGGHPVSGPIGAVPPGAGAGMGAGGQSYRRRFPFDAEDPFDTGQKASPPVIGL
jgi:hypothetical protein